MLRLIPLTWKLRSESTEFLQMKRGQALKARCSIRGQAQVNHAMVFGVSDANDQASSVGPVNEPDDTVMAK